MPDEPFNEENEQDDDGESGVVKSLRERGDTNEKRAETAERELAFLKAGIDTDSPMGKFFADKYDGDMTAEAVTAAASEIGLTEVIEGDPPPPPKVTEEQQQEQQVRETISGGAPSGANTEIVKDPYEEGYEAFREAQANGIPDEVAAAQFFDRVFDAAAKGDERVIYKPEEWRERVYHEKGYR